MATSPNIDSLSKDERKLIVSALDLKAASVLRSARAETDDAVRALREKQFKEVEALAFRFSQS